MPDSPAKETPRYDAAGYNDVAAMISDYRIRRTRSPTIPEIRDKLEISRTKAYEHRRRFFNEELAAIREVMAYEIPNAIARYLESAEKSLRMLIEALDKASNPKDMVILIEKLEDTHFKMIRIMGLEGVGMLDEIDRQAAARRKNDDGGNGSSNNSNSSSNASEKTDEDSATATVTATTAGKNNVRGILDMMKEKAGDTVTFADGLDDDNDDDNDNNNTGKEKGKEKITAAKGSNNARKKDRDDQDERSKVYCGSLTGNNNKKTRRDSINTFIGDTVDSINDAEAY